MISRVSNIKREIKGKRGDLLSEKVIPLKKGRSPRPGGTSQHQNPPMVRRASWWSCCLVS